MPSAIAALVAVIVLGSFGSSPAPASDRRPSRTTVRELTPIPAPSGQARPIVFAAVPAGPRGKSQCDNRGDTELFTAGPNGGPIRRITRDDHYQSHPSWSPSARAIVFSRRSADLLDQDLYVLRAGGRQVRITSGKARDLYPRWSPDGNRIVFVRVFPKWRNGSSGSDERTLMVVRPDGSHLRRLLPRRVYRGEVGAGWAPGGRRIVFTRDGRPKVSTNLWVMDRRGGGRRELTHVDHAEYSLPDWSADGRWITYSSYGAYEHAIRRVRRDGTGRTRLSPRTLIDPHASVWGPGGRRIAFVASRTGCRPSLFRMTREGRRVTDLLKERDLDVQSLDW